MDEEVKMGGRRSVAHMLDGFDQLVSELVDGERMTLLLDGLVGHDT